MTQSIAVPCRLLAQFWGLGRSPGATRGRAVLLATVLVILTGCATGPRIPESIAPEPKVPTATWALVEQDILLASAAAKAETAAYAHRAVDQWMGRVRRYTEENYIHWYTSYWTQQWLAFKVALYQSDEAESDAVAVRKLARYLQDKYLSKVLEPASQEIDPSGILHQATVMYVRTLADKIKAIGQRYGLPEKAFRNRLNQISVISGEGALAPGTSLGHLIYNHDLGGLSAYAALMEQIELGGG